ncbi:MAG: transcriptional repressor [Verrucomicrobia bacterium]|nr:transcriptional repressor [Verrucomicrobiota bacterium]
MNQNLSEADLSHLQEALSRSGQKVTPQRETVFKVLLSKRDHPSVDEVYNRAREAMPGLSLATVYNCLETFVGCGLVRQVNHERESTRYCPNLAPHAHFRDKATGRVHDIDLPPEVLSSLRSILPPGFDSETIEISFHGRTQAKDGHAN